MQRSPVLILVLLLTVALAGCAVQPAPNAMAQVSPVATGIPTATPASAPSPAPSGTLAPTRTLRPTASPTPSATPSPTPDLPAFSPVEREHLDLCELSSLTLQGETRAMEVRCQLPEGAAVYAVIDGRVEVSGSEPWLQVNLFYPNREDGFVIYHLHGDWEMAVAHGAQVKQGDLLARGRKPLSDGQSESLVLGRGEFAPVGYANVELPEEVARIWMK